MKRLLDVMLSFIGLVLLAPFFLLIAVVIWIDSHGPAFFLQDRVGKDGKIFKLYKFRTMMTDSASMGIITVGKDSRITHVGSFLRKFKFDELPQLINVLNGEMSLVGPRPELKRFTDLYSVDQRKVLSVRPGITDNASIQFRNENQLLDGKSDPVEYYIREIMPAKLKLNLDYLRDQSLWTDIKILSRTLVSIFKN